MLRSTVSWHVFDLTHSPAYLGFVGLVQFAPPLLLSLFAGVVADRFDRRRIVMVGQTVSASVAAMLALGTAHDQITLLLIFAGVVTISAAATFQNPAGAAILPSIMRLEVLPRVVTIASTGQALAFASGPAIGGVIIGSAGIVRAYATVTGLLCLSLLLLSRMRYTPRSQERTALSWASMVEGVRFLASNRVILGCMTLDMFAVIFGGAVALLPIYANEILKVGAHGYGVLSASMEVGALSTSLVLMFRRPIQRSGRAMLIAIGVFGVATMIFGASRSFPLSIAAYMLAGMADQVSVVMRHTMIQLNTPDVLRGRVSAVNFIFIGASNQLGAAESGFVAALTSAPFSVVSGGFGCLVVLAVVSYLIPELRRYHVATRNVATSPA